MNLNLTIPVFNAADPTTVITVPSSGPLRLLRCAGAATVRLHRYPPTSDAQEAEGWPLGPNAADNELGEALTSDSLGRTTASQLYATARTASALRVMLA